MCYVCVCFVGGILLGFVPFTWCFVGFFRLLYSCITIIYSALSWLLIRFPVLSYDILPRVEVLVNFPFILWMVKTS